MTEYKVTVVEEVETVIYVEANSEDEAREVAHDLFMTDYASRDYIWHDTEIEER